MKRHDKMGIQFLRWVGDLGPVSRVIIDAPLVECIRCRRKEPGRLISLISKTGRGEDLQKITRPFRPDDFSVQFDSPVGWRTIDASSADDLNRDDDCCPDCYIKWVEATLDIQSQHRRNYTSMIQKWKDLEGEKPEGPPTPTTGKQK